MKKNNLASKTTQELESLKKTTSMIVAILFVVILLLMFYFLYYMIKHGFTPLYFLPILLMPVFAFKYITLNKIKAELETRKTTQNK